MAAFLGRLEVKRLQTIMSGTLRRAERIDPEEIELRSDLAKYICICISGYFEQAVKELAIEWCRNQAGPTVVRYATRQLDRLQNVNGERLTKLLASFDSTWPDRLQGLAPEIDALNSIYSNRNQIAHGGNAGITLVRVREYSEQVQRIVDMLIELLDPPPSSSSGQRRAAAGPGLPPT